MLNAKQAKGGGGGPTQNLEAGAYPARVVIIAALGLQAQRPFKGEEKPPVEELLVVYEALDEFLKDEDGNEMPDKPFWFWDRMPFYNLKSERAKSTKRYMALDPTVKYEGEWAKLIGTPCLVTISRDERDGKVYNNVTSIAPMRAKDADKAPELVNPSVLFDPDTSDLDTFHALPDGVQNWIKNGLEFKGSRLDKLLSGGSQEHQEHEPEQESFDERDTSW